MSPLLKKKPLEEDTSFLPDQGGEDTSFLPDQGPVKAAEDTSFLPDQGTPDQPSPIERFADMLIGAPTNGQTPPNEQKPPLADAVTGIAADAMERMTGISPRAAQVSAAGSVRSIGQMLGLVPQIPFSKDLATGAEKAATAIQPEDMTTAENVFAGNKEKLADLAAKTPGQIETEAKVSGRVNKGDILKRAIAETLAPMVPTTPVDAVFLADAAENIAQRLRVGDIGAAFTKWVKTKEVNVPISADDIRGFFTMAKDSVSPEVYDALLKTPKEELVSMAKRAMAGEDVFLKTRVPRFGGKPSAAPAPGEAGAAAPSQGGDLVPVGGTNEPNLGEAGGAPPPQPGPTAALTPAAPQPAVQPGPPNELPPTENVPRGVNPPSIKVDENSISPQGIAYINQRFPKLGSIITGKNVSLTQEQLHDVITKASTAGEAALLKGSAPEEADLIASKTFATEMKPYLDLNTAQAVPVPKPVKLDERGLPIRRPGSVVATVPTPTGETAKITHQMILDEAQGLLSQAQEKRAVGALEDFVISNGGLKSFRADETGKVPEAEEMRSVPLRFKNRNGLAPDEMAQMAYDQGLLPEPSADLLRNELKGLAVRGKAPQLADFYDEAQRNLEEYHATSIPTKTSATMKAFGLSGDEIGQYVKAKQPAPEKMPEWVTEDQGTTDEVAAEPRAAYGVQQTETPEFKKWFGESKVVDEKGQPQVLYHQTKIENEPLIEKEGFSTDPAKARARLSDEMVPNGIFFKPDTKDIGVGGQAKEVTQVPVFLSMKNPLIVRDRDALMWELSHDDSEYYDLAKETVNTDHRLSGEYDRYEKKLIAELPEGKRWDDSILPKLDAFLEKWKKINAENAGKARARIDTILKAKGYDGVIIENDAGSFGRRTKTYIALDPTQVKSATKNVGTFDPTNPSIVKDVHAGYGIKQVDTPEFKKWFSGSKVVDAGGQPLVQYHSTKSPTGIPEFEKRFGMTAHFGTLSAAEDRMIQAREDGTFNDQDPASIVPVYLSIKNPIRMSDVHFDEARTMAEDLVERGIITVREAEKFGGYSMDVPPAQNIGKLVDLLKKKGYDGIVYQNKIEDKGSDTYIPFEPTQIKSAIANRGTFEPNNPSIVKEGTGSYAGTSGASKEERKNVTPFSVEDAKIAIKKEGGYTLAHEGPGTEFTKSESEIAPQNAVPAEAGGQPSAKAPVRLPGALFDTPYAVQFRKTGSVVIPNKKISSPADLAYAFKFLHDETQENFYLGAVKDGRIVAVEHLGMGTVDQVAAYPYETLNLLSQKEADGYFVVHNHPSGYVMPSEEDKRLTVALRDLLSKTNRKFMGHVIINGGKFGFIDEGLNAAEFWHNDYKRLKKLPILRKYTEWFKTKEDLMKGPMLTSPARVLEMTKSLQSDMSAAVAYLLNAQNTVLNALVLPKDKIQAGYLMELAASHRAVGMILVNSGISNQDYVTLKGALKTADIRLQDAIDSIPGKDLFSSGYVSKLEQGFSAERAQSPYAASELNRGYRSDEGRIRVQPIEGKPPKSLRDITLDISKALKTRVITGKVGRAGGKYFPGSSATLIRFSGDLDTTAHELAHSLDDKLGIVAEWNKPGFVSPFDDELAKFWPYGSVTESGPHSEMSYKRAEGVAEFMRAFLVNPAAAIDTAPNFAGYLRQKLPADTIKALKMFSDDIRTFAGANAHEQIMSNVNWRPPESPTLKWFAGKNIGADFHLTFADRLRSIVQDDIHAFNKAVDYVRGERGIESLLPRQDPRVLARLIMGVHAKMDDIFEKGMIDSNNKRITQGGINYLFEPLDTSSFKSLEKDVQEVASYMIAQRTLERAQLKDYARVSGIGGGIMSDVSVAAKRLAEIESNPAHAAKIKEAARRYREWGDAVLRYMLGKGRLSAEQYDLIKANNEYYVAMNRLMEIAPNEEILVYQGKGGGNKIGSVSQPIQKFTGSTRTILNPYTSLMESTYRAIRESDRNDVLKTFRDLLTNERGMSEGQPGHIGDVGRLAKSGDKNTIPIYVRGEKEIWQFQEDVYKALKGMVDGSFQVPWPLTVPAKILRATVVNFPPFAIRNWFRDLQSRVVVSDVGSGLMEAFKKRGPMDVDNLRIHGGDQAGHYLRDRVDYIRAMDTALRDLVHDRNTVILHPSKLVNAWENLMALTEQSGRLSEYSAAYRYGKNVLKYDDENAMLFAASKARDLMDFAVAGSLIRVINQVVPFTNAQVQGLWRTARAGKDRPGETAAKWLLYSVIPAITVYLYNYLQGNINEYRSLPAYQRDMFYNFKMGPDLWLRVPKSYEIGVLATGFERALDAAMGNKRSYDGYSGSLARGLFPVDEGALVGPASGAVQAIANYDFFRQKHIVPLHEERLDLSLRETGRASRLAQAIQSVVGIDARKVDFLMRQMFGYAGGLAADMSDIGRKDRRGLSLAQTGFFNGAPAYASPNVQWVMDQAARRGLVNHPIYKRFNKMVSAYFNAESAADKDAAAQALVEVAGNIRDQWERHPLQRKSQRKKK